MNVTAQFLARYCLYFCIHLADSCQELINEVTMTEKLQCIAPPKCTDANPKFYPVKRAPNGVGQYVEISADSKKCDYWMYLLGTALAEKRKMHLQGKSRLQALPPKYKMFDHQRHGKSDIYIYGHPSKERFRSALQFRRHLLWLDQKSSKPPCDCKLCELLPVASEKKAMDIPLKQQKKTLNQKRHNKNDQRRLQQQLPKKKQRIGEKQSRLLSPAPWIASQTKRSGTSVSSQRSNTGTVERTPSQEIDVNEVLTPHKLGLSNPLPLKTRNKRIEK